MYNYAEIKNCIENYLSAGCLTFQNNAINLSIRSTAYYFIETVEQLQLEYIHTRTVSFTVFLVQLRLEA